MRFLLSCALVMAMPAAAQELQLPVGAKQLTDRVNPLASYDLPTGPFANDGIPVRTLEGRIEKRSWRVAVGAGTTLQVLAPLRTQLQEAGYDILLDCAARTCGGFDFRFGTEVIPAPDMYVAVRDYRFLSATKGDQALSLLVSRQSPDAYIQIIRVSPGTQEIAPIVTQAEVPTPGAQSFSDLLKQDGHVILEGLAFKEGANTLQEEEAPVLQTLVEILEAESRSEDRSGWPHRQHRCPRGQISNWAKRVHRSCGICWSGVTASRRTEFRPKVWDTLRRSKRMTPPKGAISTGVSRL